MTDFQLSVALMLALGGLLSWIIVWALTTYDEAPLWHEPEESVMVLEPPYDDEL